MYKYHPYKQELNLADRFRTISFIVHGILVESFKLFVQKEDPTRVIKVKYTSLWLNELKWNKVHSSRLGIEEKYWVYELAFELGKENSIETYSVRLWDKTGAWSRNRLYSLEVTFLNLNFGKSSVENTFIYTLT